MEGFGGQGKEESGEGELREQKKRRRGRGSDAGEARGGVDRSEVGELERLKERNSAAVEDKPAIRNRRGKHQEEEKERKDNKQM